VCPERPRVLVLSTRAINSSGLGSEVGRPCLPCMRACGHCWIRRRQDLPKQDRGDIKMLPSSQNATASLSAPTRVAKDGKENNPQTPSVSRPLYLSMRAATRQRLTSVCLDVCPCLTLTSDGGGRRATNAAGRGRLGPRHVCSANVRGLRRDVA
jgi:hypothetical protein